jgi:hypothetical protein
VGYLWLSGWGLRFHSFLCYNCSCSSSDTERYSVQGNIHEKHRQERISGRKWDLFSLFLLMKDENKNQWGKIMFNEIKCMGLLMGTSKLRLQKIQMII